MLSGLKKLKRMCYIQWIIAKYGLDEIILALPWFVPFRFLSKLNPWNWYRSTAYTAGQRIRLALEALGPIFIKLGQMLSTRPDLIPEPIVKALSLLQDKVPPFPQAKARIQSLYGVPLEDLFASVDDTPLASASVAQVHAARLLDGRSVVIKVLRPGIHQIIDEDVSLMMMLAGWAERWVPLARRFKATAVIAEFKRTLQAELDLVREAANGAQLRRNFLGDPRLYVPEMHWPYVQKSVCVMERIEGIPISQVALLEEKGVDLARLAVQGVEIFFTQVFRDCFFHADMHPGNIFVNPSNGQYIAVDFGIMGILSAFDQRYLAENMLAFFKRDYRRVAELHVASGWVSARTRVHELEAAIRAVCEPIFERPLKDISCGQLLLRLFQAGQSFEMVIQPQLVLLQKTLLHIEGLGRQLYPELDLWCTAKPFLERWLKSQLGWGALIHKIRHNLPYWGEKFPELPDLVYRALQQYAGPQGVEAGRGGVEFGEERGFFRGVAAVLLLGGVGCLLGAPGFFLGLSLSWQAVGTMVLLLGLLSLGIASRFRGYDERH